MDVFGLDCPWNDCSETITRATGDLDAELVSVRCDEGHRSSARASDNSVELTPNPDGETLETAS